MEHYATLALVRFIQSGSWYFFADFQICTQNNGQSSNWITPTRGLHQGCCISPHLYNLTGQLFADLFTNNTELDGLTFNQILNLLSQFADGTNIYLKYTKSNIDHILQTLQISERNLGLKVNYNKTTIYRIGSIMNTNAKLYTLKNYVWDDPPITTLGIEVDVSWEKMCNNNLNPLLAKVDGVFSMWNNRALTLSGRVLVVNTLVESLFVYKFSVLPIVTNDWIEKMHKKIVNYVWQGKRAKIPFDTLKRPKNQGGLRLVDLRAKHTALIAQWISMSRKDPFLQADLQQYVDHYIGVDIWKINMRPQEVELYFEQSFWREVLKAWCKCTYFKPATYGEIVEQPLWYNSHIKMNGKCIFFKKLNQQGVKTIFDLLAQDNTFVTFENINEYYPNCITWLEYRGLVNAIPCKWKREILNNNAKNEQFTSFYETLEGMKENESKSKVIYRKLTQSSAAALNSFERWTEHLQGIAYE